LSERETAPVNERTIGDIIRDALPTAHIQFLFESISNVTLKRIGGKRGVEQTIVTFATPRENLTPDHVLWLTLSASERRDPRYGGRKPPYVPVIVWVPAAIYEGATPQEEPRG